MMVTVLSFGRVDAVNRASLSAIEGCMFILCLDKSMPLSFNHQQSVDETSKNLRDDTSLALQMLHGHGASHNAANRWFDKTLQVGGTMGQSHIHVGNLNCGSDALNVIFCQNVCSWAT